MIESHVFFGKWKSLENFVHFEMPPSHDLCFLTNKDELQTYVLCTDPRIVTRLKIHFDLVESEMDTSMSYKGWTRRGNKNLLPEIDF